MINNLIQRGLGNMQAKMHKELGNVDKSINDFYNNENIRNAGAGVMFLDETAQRTNIMIKSRTPPPPSYVGQ
jgi:hypothetical protein